MAAESKIQTKILKFLLAEGFVADKIIVASRAGVLDIVACSTTGKYWSIEVKAPEGTESALQEYRRKRIIKAGGIAFTCYSYEEFLQCYHLNL